jgi:phage tail tape-measure protein
VRDSARPEGEDGPATELDEAASEGSAAETRDVGLGSAGSATAGGVTGAAVGGVVGGPPGMVVGAVTGAARGVLLQRVAEKVDELADEKGREIADTLFGPPDDEEDDAAASLGSASADPNAA